MLPASLMHAVGRTGDGIWIRCDGTRIGLECAGEELIEAAIAERVGLGGFGHVDRIELEKAAHQPILEPLRAHPGAAQHQPRQRMLRQQVLKPDEQPAAAHARPVTMRRKSLCSALTVNGPLKDQRRRRPAGSRTKIALEVIHRVAAVCCGLQHHGELPIVWRWPQWPADQSAVRPMNSGIEVGHVLRQLRRRVALGVNRHEDHLRKRWRDPRAGAFATRPEW